MKNGDRMTEIFHQNRIDVQRIRKGTLGNEKKVNT